MSVNRSTRFPQWAIWLIGAVSILAIAILVLSVVLGVRAGQNQLILRRNQQVGIALQSAIDHREAGNLQQALDEYQRVLALEPGNAAAVEGIETLLQMAGGTPAALSAVPAAAPTVDLSAAPDAALTSGPPSTLATPAPAGAAALPAGSLEAAWAQAEKDFRAGRWQEAVDELLLVRQQDATFRSGEVGTLLFDGYVNLATERDNEDNLEAALVAYDHALSLRPDAAAVRAERDLVQAYLEVLTYYSVDWQRAAQLLTDLYAREPEYRDVEERLQTALTAYGEQLAGMGDWCAAADQYDAATALTASPELLAVRSQARQVCENGGTPVALVASTGANSGGTPAPGARAAGTATPGEGAELPEPPAASAALAPTPQAPAGAPAGRILYSTRSLVDGRTHTYVQPAAGGAAAILIEDAGQPALRDDGQRLAFRNLRGDQAGISAFDPATGLMFRITEYAEDVLPSWNPQGSQVVFASNREGDRRWRIYAAWAEQNGDVSTLSYGEAPEWHPAAERIVHRGCDQNGNSCGLWLMSGSGGDRTPLTAIPADNRPVWSPDGSYVVFMSDGRDGNMELYRIGVDSGEVLRLTDSPAIDALPTVSPDGQWVAFASNRDGGWKIWAVPLAGGQPRLIASLQGELGDWASQELQWVF